MAVIVGVDFGYGWSAAYVTRARFGFVEHPAEKRKERVHLAFGSDHQIANAGSEKIKSRPIALSIGLGSLTWYRLSNIPFSTQRSMMKTNRNAHSNASHGRRPYLKVQKMQAIAGSQ